MWNSYLPYKTRDVKYDPVEKIKPTNHLTFYQPLNVLGVVLGFDSFHKGVFLINPSTN